ncbi:GntR family transcriptional regulator / MocR family aminotransferase [Chitinophaga jiangningensis]|uniref:GntR family transcriptional regulator / MocR family aminotransferase n=1 Tax=Chitinophaga jiangningensis TaxID=1419482 RepID=A0A1M6Y4K1_9BACT|nr:PLP-dependent aminotransferase family protein [Chitinophaga jiangningensis]SHL13166.1 GntR family transcriptional regulator / MocR family aminotransferase [Chitinophaga jiangningensis]
MGSPVSVPYESFVQIDRESATAVYIQIANQLVNAIQRGYVVPGTRLPGTRELSELLRLHRNTIVAAYEELDAQGWVESRPNKGTYVIGNPEAKPRKIRATEEVPLVQYPTSTGFSFKKSSLLDSPFEHAACEYIFNDGTPDIRLTQVAHLSSLYSANMKRKSNHRKLGYYNHDGSEFFKRNLSNYLNVTRGLHISPNNLLITRSTEMSVYITSEILLSKGDIVLVGALSYFSVNMIFQKSGARIMPVPIDEEGIDVDAVRDICTRQTIRMLYITPHHHYPTTVTLSAQRRLALLNLSAEFGFIILEDDYDYDFHYDKSPVLPLASADKKGMVVYIGAFGKSLAPGFRTGFIVAPENLMVEMRKHLGIIDRQGDILMEQVLGEMIEEGEIHRYLKKSLKVYHERRNHFTSLLQQHLGDHLHFQQPSGGLAVWTEWKQPVNLFQLAKECAKNNLFIPKTLLYQHRQLSGMRLGFGHMTLKEATESIEILRHCLQ